jgi:tetratricopeptide (TPR) repeat protein
MKIHRFGFGPAAGGMLPLVLAFGSLAGCGPSFRELRMAGQEQMISGHYGTARNLFREALEKVPEDAENLYDLGDCSVYLAKERFRQRNEAAAMRYADQAVDYYSRSINAHPGFEPALWGKNMALELKRQFHDALQVAEWAAEFVGPSAQQQLFLAHELEEREDLDAALLRYRQAVAMEPNNAHAQAEMGRFLLRIDRRDQAARHLRAAYRLNPTEPGVREDLLKLGIYVPLVPSSSREPQRRASPAGPSD